MKKLLTTIRRLYRNAPISQKLFLAFSLMIAVPAVVVSFLFIRNQESQLFKQAMAEGSNHVDRLNERLRSRLELLENASATALTQKGFVDFIHSNMRADGLRLVKFKQNQYEQMHNIIQSHEMISSLSFYVDNPEVYEIWPEVYHYSKFWPQDYWMTLRDEGGAAFRLSAFKDGADTLSYYRLVRLQGQQQKLPTIMEVRAKHNVLFNDLLEDSGRDFFTVIMDGADASRNVYLSGHELPQKAGAKLDDILSRVHAQLDVLEQKSPVTVQSGDQSYYALYRYIAPLNAYVVDIASRHELTKVRVTDTCWSSRSPPPSCC